MADYLYRHPTELHAASVEAETFWNEWFTVNSVIELNDVLENSETSSEKDKPAKSVNETNSVIRINNATENQPIRGREKRNLRETSKSHCGNTAGTRKMSQSPSIRLLNEKLLQASYVADKLNQRVINSVKTIIKPALRVCRCHCERSFNRYCWMIKNSCI